ncbi:MAG: hypothetical protein CFK52_06570 [Chloracidobacterium sp. CP2_5A]|nr:MAG: hypothetical protein CFK52_06570 [Chloracidobacterium sp. CP2_5A]
MKAYRLSKVSMAAFQKLQPQLHDRSQLYIARRQCFYALLTMKSLDSEMPGLPSGCLKDEADWSLLWTTLGHHYDIVWIRRLADDSLMFFGDGLARLWGCSVADAVQDPSQLDKAIHPADRSLRANCWQSSVADDNWEIEYRVIQPSGETRWVRESAMTLRDSTDQPTHLAGLIRDVTRYKLAERICRETERQWWKFFEQNPLGCCLLSARSLRFAAANAAFAELIGYPVEEIIGRHPDDFGLWLDPTLPRLVFQSLRQFAQSEVFETALRLPTQELRQVELTAMTLEAGDQRYIALMCRDVTRAKQLQRQLMDDETRFRALFMGLPDIVAHISSEGRVYDVNHADFGYEKAALLERNFLDWFAVEDRPQIQASLAQSLTEIGDRQAFEARIQHSDGTLKWYAGRVAGAHFNESITEFLITLRDVAAQKQAADELRQLNHEIAEANAKLRELDKLKARFAATLVHDLRSPLTSIYSALEILDNASIDDGLRYLLSISRSSLQRALDMISSIQHIYQAEEGMLKLDCALITPQAFIQACWEAACIEGRKKELAMTLAYAFDADEPPLLYGDAPKLERAFNNLLLNALKFTPPGGSITLNVSIINGSGVNIGRDFVEISILDTGVGIPPEDLPYIFDAYRQSRNNRTGVGFGLGLAIVKSVIAAHGGDVRVESQIGIGTQFSIQLPIAAARVASAASSAPAKKSVRL